MKLKIATVLTIALSTASAAMSQGLAPGWPCTPPSSANCAGQLIQFARVYTCKRSIQPLPPALQETAPMNKQQFDQYVARMQAAGEAETAREIADLAMQTGTSRQEATAAWNRAEADLLHAYCCSDQGEEVGCPERN
jgi:hypothetical protein